ncbi:bifunctional riboflavin kinase/FAD synthetase [bacterium]|nr:bifunctional riboflavin kinase/FAD synthetase [bacterium]MBU1884826.1 bifunctional riboflavin kinase/FAD synthetase [bacterium]
MKNSDTIAIGGFDGMHVGHQHLFRELGEYGCIVVIDSGFANITPHKEREDFTHYPVFYFALDKIRHLEAKGFLELLKENFPKLKKIVVGYDFHFGKDRAYDYDDLKEIFEGEVKVVDEVKVNGESVHSRTIRKKLSHGDIKSANSLLGHNYSIRGNLIKGQGLGAKELVATINLHVRDYLLPKEGVYTTLTRIDDEEHFHPSVSFIGHRVSTDGTFAVETHLLDGDIECSTKATISFVDFIRENMQFDMLDDLKKQINRDINIAKDELKMLQL